MKLQLWVLSESPLALSASRATEQFAAGLDYIPGSTLRGALAAHYLREIPNRQPDDTFRALFMSDKIIYADLLPTLSKTATGHLFPATTQACKRYKLSHPRSLEDALLELAAYAESLERWEEEPGPIPTDLVNGKYCPVCQTLRQQNPLQFLGGYYTLTSSQNFTIDPIRSIHQRLITGTSINRQTGTAQTGMLFSRDALEEGQYFSGQIWLADDVADEVSAALQQLVPEQGVLRVGYGRSRGLGKLRIITCRPVTASGPTLAERWQKFNEKAGAAGLWPQREYFSLTLESDWIRGDRPFDQPDRLPDGAEIGLSAAQRHRSVVKHSRVMGWNAARKLPKKSQPALRRGSVLLFSLPKEQAAGAQEILGRLETTGLGQRRNEGFGRVSVCHPFHYQTIKVEGEDER